jgi:hypothetical protein
MASLNEDAAVDVGKVSDLQALLGAIGSIASPSSHLYVEGTSIAPDVLDFLSTNKSAPRLEVAQHTGWPRPQKFHLRATPEILQKLSFLAEHHADREIATHLALYDADGILVEAHDVGDGHVVADRRVGEEVLNKLRAIAD